ncbi:allantoinase [Modestobacter roseus]|uniref:allantoinase n=1 Tax=Modestobacter roseus TaxID=1181884 RepID=A0A562IQU9_9ACTN|nr:allantoinase AllB [Modestobacter roseus]MQA34317.1 allantoinase AllB [Modestobacter roseus]TWH72964.1 allantoinase [Modestobacter roseus]
MTASPTAVRARRVLVGDAVRPATVRIADGRISAIDPHDSPADGALEVPDTATLLPGVVDTHVHVNEPGRTHWEGFATATRAAALGGVTTLVDMPLNSLPPTTTVGHLRRKQEAARGQLAVDVGFWGGAVPGNAGELEPLWDAGVFGFKCFLSPSGVDEFPPLDGAGFTRALRTVAGFGGLVIVHAEDAAVLASAPARPSRAYADFLLSRPDDAETAAIQQVVDGARETGARVHVLHLSSARALPLLQAARDEGLPVTVETCHHYLTFTAEQIPDAAPQFKCCPPIRDAGNRDELWSALRAGVVDCVVSDHSPATAEEKNRGDGDLQQAWGGVSGLQVGFTALAAEAARRGIDVADVSRWTSQNTADLVGLSRKGRIAVGADADLVVHDTAAATVVDAARLAHRNPVSAYDGLTLPGRVTHTLVRGRLVDPDLPDPGWGTQLERSA